MDRKIFGKEGEIRAASFLKSKGYRIIQTNYLKRTGEIDIIAFDPEHSEFVFTEVKTRSNKAFGDPEDAVDDYKIAKIAETAETWLYDNDIDSDDWRIDIICVELNGNKMKIRHLENVS